MILTSLAIAISIQAFGESVIAIKNDDPETWVVEYPRIIQPQVADYRRCLAVSDRRIAGKADFEAQHTSDLARCADRRAKAEAEANAAFVGAKTVMNSGDIAQLFADIGRIHVARGADLDRQFRSRMVAAAAASETYEAGRPKGLVIELHDASVIKARTDATAPAATSDQDKDG